VLFNKLMLYGLEFRDHLLAGRCHEVLVVMLYRRRVLVAEDAMLCCGRVLVQAHEAGSIEIGRQSGQLPCRRIAHEVWVASSSSVELRRPQASI
jgi:hypothetical protein